MSGGVGLGWIDSHANIPGAVGQDFTFNILSAVAFLTNWMRNGRSTSACL